MLQFAHQRIGVLGGAGEVGRERVGVGERPGGRLGLQGAPELVGEELDAPHGLGQLHRGPMIRVAEGLEQAFKRLQRPMDLVGGLFVEDQRRPGGDLLGLITDGRDLGADPRTLRAADDRLLGIEDHRRIARVDGQEDIADEPDRGHQDDRVRMEGVLLRERERHLHLARAPQFDVGDVTDRKPRDLDRRTPLESIDVDEDHGPALSAPQVAPLEEEGPEEEDQDAGQGQRPDRDLTPGARCHVRS